MRDLVCLFLNVYLLILLTRIVLSWFPLAPDGVARQIYGFLGALTEPVLGPLRRTLPPVRMGTVGLDLSPIVVFIGIYVLEALIGCT